METSKIQEIAQLFIDNPELTSNEVMEGYIFGTYAENEHYSIDEIEKIRTVVLADTAVPEETVIPEEPQEPTPEPIPEPTIEEIVEELLNK